MTRDALAGRETAYYPAGRATQQPATLSPEPGASPRDVLDDWTDTAERLDSLWRSLDRAQWSIIVTEPPNNPDLGPAPLERLALSRLTEVDVHGVDLGIGFPDWSDSLIDAALPARLGCLSTRRTNHRSVDRSLQGTWLLSAEGFRWVVTVEGDSVTSMAAEGSVIQLRARNSGTRWGLLALLIEREQLQSLEITGDVSFGAGFHRAFPGP
jgi:hypothetical protein